MDFLYHTDLCSFVHTYSKQKNPFTYCLMHQGVTLLMDNLIKPQAHMCPWKSNISKFFTGPTTDNGTQFCEMLPFDVIINGVHRLCPYLAGCSGTGREKRRWRRRHFRELYMQDIISCRSSRYRRVMTVLMAPSVWFITRGIHEVPVRTDDSRVGMGS